MNPKPPSRDAVSEPAPSWLRPEAGGVLLRLHVQPKARRSEACGVYGDRLKLRIASPPVDGKANREIVEFLAEALRVGRSQVGIVRGETGRDKDVSIAGTTVEAVRRALKA